MVWLIFQIFINTYISLWFEFHVDRFIYVFGKEKEKVSIEVKAETLDSWLDSTTVCFSYRVL